MNLLNSGTRLPSRRSSALFPQPFPQSQPPSFFFFFATLASRSRTGNENGDRVAPLRVTPRHSHHVVTLCISLTACPSPFFFPSPSLALPRALSVSSSSSSPPSRSSPFPSSPSFAFSAWRISRNPNDVRAGSGFVFFVPGPPFSKRALKEKRT